MYRNIDTVNSLVRALDLRRLPIITEDLGTAAVYRSDPAQSRESEIRKRTIVIVVARLVQIQSHTNNIATLFNINLLNATIIHLYDY